MNMQLMVRNQSQKQGPCFKALQGGPKQSFTTKQLHIRHRVNYVIPLCRSVRRVHIFLPLQLFIGPSCIFRIYITKSVTHGQYDARPTVTFPATECNRSVADTKLYCLMTEAHRCK